MYSKAKIQVFHTFHKFQIKNIEISFMIENVNDFNQHFMRLK